MMQEACVPLRSKFLAFDGRALKSLLYPSKCTSFSPSLLNHTGFQLPNLYFNYIPCIAKCDTRLFHSSHSVPTLHNSFFVSSSPLFGQRRLSNYQNFSLASLHTSADIKFKLFETIPNISSCVSISNLELLKQELPIHSQFRLLHKQSSRKRFGRPFSSQEKSTVAASDKDGEQDGDKNEEQKLTVYQRFKKTYKKHGKVLVTVHILTSVVWYGMFYTAARCGVDIVPLLEKWNMSEKMISPFRSGGLGDFALAYLMYKLMTPARYTVTLGGTNLALRYLKKEGKMEQIPKEDSLRELYKDGKEEVKTKGRNTRHRLKHMRHRIQGRIRRVRRRNHDRRDR